MNLPNKLTILRIALIPVFVALVSFDGPWLQFWAAVAFGAASLTDYLDGHIARKRGLVTDFGKLMDPMADKLLVLSALVMLTAQGRANAVCVLIILAREFVIMSIRLVAVQKGVVIAADMLGKIKTVLQLIAILLVLMTVLPLYDPYVRMAGQWLLWASAAMSVLSCVNYIRKNREVFRP